jgi:hypothetical protein
MGNILFKSCVDYEVDKFITGTNLIYDSTDYNKPKSDCNFKCSKKHEKYLSIYS